MAALHLRLKSTLLHLMYHFRVIKRTQYDRFSLQQLHGLLITIGQWSINI